MMYYVFRLVFFSYDKESSSLQSKNKYKNVQS